MVPFLVFFNVGVFSEIYIYIFIAFNKPFTQINFEKYNYVAQ